MAEKNENTNNTKNIDSYYQDNLWQMRPCILYSEEYKYCGKNTCQLYNEWRTGKQEDCTKWKRFSESCISFDNTGDIDHVKEIVDFEVERRKERLQAAKNNNVWEYRKPIWDDKQIKDNLKNDSIKKEHDEVLDMLKTRPK